MKMCYIILFIVLISLSDSVNANHLYKKGTFSISLPDGWVEIPREIIDAHEREIKKMVPNATPEHYDYGFQLDNAEKWFEYPYILIQINNKGRIPESQIKRLDKYSFQERINKFKDNFSRVLSYLQLEKPYYDKTTNIIWLRAEANVKNVGPIANLGGIIPTEKGFILVSGSTLKRSSSTYEHIFILAVTSVKPSNELVYKPNRSDSSPKVVRDSNLYKSEQKVLSFILFTIIILLFARHQRKKKRR